jgi:hypothetical protein
MHRKMWRPYCTMLDGGDVCCLSCWLQDSLNCKLCNHGQVETLSHPDSIMLGLQCAIGWGRSCISGWRNIRLATGGTSKSHPCQQQDSALLRCLPRLTKRQDEKLQAQISRLGQGYFDSGWDLCVLPWMFRARGMARHNQMIKSARLLKVSHTCNEYRSTVLYINWIQYLRNWWPDSISCPERKTSECRSEA